MSKHFLCEATRLAKVQNRHTLGIFRRQNNADRRHPMNSCVGLHLFRQVSFLVAIFLKGTAGPPGRRTKESDDTWIGVQAVERAGIVSGLPVFLL